MAALCSCVAVYNTYRPQLKCVPLEDVFRTKPGLKSTQVRSVKEPDITVLSKSSVTAAAVPPPKMQAFVLAINACCFQKEA